jgi:preprotein translocase subunit SecD
VFFSRGLVNFWYGGKKKLQGVSIGQVWKPAARPGTDSPSTSTAVTTPKA